MDSQEKPPVNPGRSAQRVKVYRLLEDGKWNDQGTGHVTVDYVEKSENLGLFVIDEDTSETLLLHRISSNVSYRKQEDTIISWRDSEISTEVALSFQETTGCTYIWDHICSLQRKLHFGQLGNEIFHNVNTELRELPPIELSNLPLILKTVVESGIADHLRVAELMLHDQFFFQKLMDLFKECEALGNTDGLHLIFRLVKGIILLNSSQIFEKIFGDELIMDIIGCLEYDPELHHVHHRNFVTERVVFKEVIPIKDPVVISKIHQTYKISYLKDTIFPEASNQAVAATLNSIIRSNNAIVVSLLKDDNSFIKDLFASLKSPITSTESKKTLIDFLHEYCKLSKNLQMVHQLRLFRDLVSGGIFDIIADVLQSKDNKLVLTGIDILILFLNLDPNILRSYLSLQEGVLFGVLIKGMLTDFGNDIHCKFYEILCTLLDQNTSGAQKDTVVEIFYEKHLGQIIDVITSSCPNGDGQLDSKSVSSDEGPMSQIRVKPEILINICDLLRFCVTQHPYRIKSNFLLNNVIDKVLYLTRRREQLLIVGAIRIVRTLLSRSDEHVMNHFVKNNLFKPVVDAFVANGDRYNVLHSTVLDLFEHIRKENLKVLLRYLVDTFWIQLVKFESLPSIRALKVQYDQSLESTGTRNSDSLLFKRKRIDEHALEKEEDYFNDNSGEEELASANTDLINKKQYLPPVLVNGSCTNHPTPRSGGLVDYVNDDDEDNDNFSPRPIRFKFGENELGAEFSLRHKLSSKDEPDAKRLQCSSKSLKPRGALKALCFSLTQANKKAAITVLSNSVEPNIQEKRLLAASNQRQTAEIENHNMKEEVSPRISTDESNESVDNRKVGDVFPLLHSSSSPEIEDHSKKEEVPPRISTDESNESIDNREGG